MKLLVQEKRMELADEEYVRSCRNGHPNEFRFLVRRYQRLLVAWLVRRLGNAPEAEEAAQECLVRAFLSLNKLRDPGAFQAWLLGIATHVAQEQCRSHSRHERDRVAAETWGVDSAPEPEAERPLEEAVAGLPETYRRVILMRYYEGASCQEIATRLALPLGTVTKTLSRAYALLRQSLRPREGQPAEEVRI